MANRIGIRGRNILLYVRLVDDAGNPTNADETPTVTIYDVNGDVEQAATNVGVSLVEDPGLYSFSFDIPLDMADGYSTDTWSLKIGDTTVANSFTFLVTSSGEISETVEPVYTPGDDVPWDFTQDEVYGINVLLKMIKPRLKSDGVRKVRDESGAYIEVPCSIFTDTELITFLINGLSEFNQEPYFTNYTFEHPQIYGVFADIIIQGGALLAMAAQTLIERGREFSITDNGISFQPPAVSDILNTQYTTQLSVYREKLKHIKMSLPPTQLGLGTFRVTAISPNFARLRHLRERSII